MENIVRIGNQFVLQPEFFNDSSGKYHEYSEDKLLDLVQQTVIEGEDWHEAIRLAIARWRLIDPKYFTKGWATVRMFSWSKYLETEFKTTRSRTCFDKVIISLMKCHRISIEDVIPYCKVFKVFVRIATDPQYSAVLHNFDFPKHTLAEQIVAAKKVKKETKINELEYLQRNGLIIPHESTYSAAFRCVETRQLRLIKFFLGVPGLAKFKRNCRTFLSFARLWLCPSWLKYFSQQDLKRMMLEDFPDSSTFRMQYPSRMLEVVKDITINSEYPSYKTIGALGIFGDVADKFVSQYLPPSIYPSSAMLKHGKSVRRDTKRASVGSRKQIGFDPESSFPVDQLPVELLLMVCEHLDTRDLISLFGISKTFKVLEGDIFYRSVYKKEFPMVYQGLISHGQPILQSDFNLLNRRRNNWRNGRFSVNYYKWKDYGLNTDSKTEVKIMDENWAVALNNNEIYLWNCHDHQRHTLFNPCLGMYAQVGILDSPPDQLPNLVVGSYHHMDVFINGNKKRYSVKTAFDFAPHFKNYYSPIGKDKIMSGQAPVIWSVEHEQKIYSIGGVSDILLAKHNPCTGLTVLTSGDGGNERHEYAILDKNFQVVLTAPRQRINSILNRHLHWIDEHFLVQVGSSGTLITDMRMLKPVQYMEKIVISPFFGSSLALEANTQRSIATVWDLNSRLWESVIVLPEDVRETVACNSRYAVFATNETGRLCVLDWQ